MELLSHLLENPSKAYWNSFHSSNPQLSETQKLQNLKCFAYSIKNAVFRVFIGFENVNMQSVEERQKVVLYINFNKKFSWSNTLRNWPILQKIFCPSKTRKFLVALNIFLPALECHIKILEEWTREKDFIKQVAPKFPFFSSLLRLLQQLEKAVKDFMSNPRNLGDDSLKVTLFLELLIRSNQVIGRSLYRQAS
jgi:hypothetical protein